MVTFLSGGTGTPKLLWGADSIFPPRDSVVIANTGDDVVLGDLHVSPDIDTLLFAGAGLLDRTKWWGIDSDPTTTTDFLATLTHRAGISSEPAYLSDEEQVTGRPLSKWRRFARVPEFMTIGDRDRAHHMVRTQLLEDGESLTSVTNALADIYDLKRTIFPMTNDPVATLIHTPDGVIHFQEYWVARQACPAVKAVEFRGAESAQPTEVVNDALDSPVVIGPANPVTSLGPMIAMEWFDKALRQTPTVMVSPFIEKEVFSGPAAQLMEGLGYEASTAGVAAMLPHVDHFVLDSADSTVLDRPTSQTDTRIESVEDARRVARACHEAVNGLIEDV